MNKSKSSNRFAPEVRDRAVRMVLEHQSDYANQWAAIMSIAPKFGCSGETLRKWVRQQERDSGVREGTTTPSMSESRPWSGRTGNCARQADRRNLHGGRSCRFEWSRHIHSGTSMPSSGGGVHPIAYDESTNLPRF